MSGRNGASIRELADEIHRTPTPALGLPLGVTAIGRQRGVITAVSLGPPLTVSLTLGGSTMPISGVRVLDGCLPSVGNVVVVDKDTDGDLEVMGTETGSGALVGSWANATLAGTWVAYGGNFATLQYRRDAMGYVHIQGAVKGGTAGSFITTLPAGYRPGARISVVFLSGATGGSAVGGAIDAAGNVQPPVAAGNAFVGLTTSFLAEN